jgi:NADH-quinone oxidoreductase subunit J
MDTVFYLAGIVAVVATFLVVVQTQAVHALLYLIVSLLSVAMIFYLLGAPFASAMEVILYAGAILVLFVFVVMMLDAAGPGAAAKAGLGFHTGAWIGPMALTAVLAAELVYVLAAGGGRQLTGAAIETKTVAMALFGPYLLGVELASMLLLSGLVGAYHIGRRWNERRPKDGGL